MPPLDIVPGHPTPFLILTGILTRTALYFPPLVCF
jgi:hypothetical protein